MHSSQIQQCIWRKALLHLWQIHIAVSLSVSVAEYMYLHESALPHGSSNKGANNKYNKGNMSMNSLCPYIKLFYFLYCLSFLPNFVEHIYSILYTGTKELAYQSGKELLGVKGGGGISGACGGGGQS